MKPAKLSQLILLLFLIGGLPATQGIVGCSGEQQRGTEVHRGRSPDTGTPPSGGSSQSSVQASNEPDSASWITRYDPERASAGLTLLLIETRHPALIDMGGRLLRQWPEIEAQERIRLTRSGTLLTISMDDRIKEYDWEGREIWSYTPSDPEDFPHHDLRRLDNGNTLLLYRDFSGVSDYVLEVDPAKNVVWSWYSSSALKGRFAELVARSDAEEGRSVTHINSIQLLPENPHADEGDARFRPGNLLVSARDLNTVFIVDRESKEIVWEYSHQLDHQHEARMVPLGYPDEGNIFIFDNGFYNLHRYRSSRVLAIDPPSGRLVWSYSSPRFFSSVGGVQQVMPNGNVVITSTVGRRIFEVDREGEIVWQCELPFSAMRPERYSRQFAPQLSDLPRFPVQAIESTSADEYVDWTLSLFATPRDFTRRRSGGRRMRILDRLEQCETIYIPPKTRLVLRYGIEYDDPPDTVGSVLQARYRATLRVRSEDETETVCDDQIRSDEVDPTRVTVVKLGTYADSWVELCLAASSHARTPDGTGARRPYWEMPVVRRPRNKKPDREPAADLRRQERRLKALGYVD